jgi:hypothetical protein
MEVVGSDDERVGVRAGALVLTLPAGEVGQQGWPHPPLLALPEG